MPAPVESCATCKFFKALKELPRGGGICRKNSPQPAPTVGAKSQADFWAWWPAVEATDWCGDHSP